MDERERARMVGERIADALHDAGLTKAELARRVGTTPTTVQRWFTGENVPPWEQARRIARVLGVPATYLLAPVLRDDDDEDSDAVLLEAERVLRELRRSRRDEPEQPEP